MALNIKVSTDYKKIPLNTRANIRSLVSIKGDETKETTPLHLGIVLDVSGSMGGTKLEKAKQAILNILEQLSDEDMISLVTFSDNAKKILVNKPAKDRRSIQKCIDEIQTKGSTNLYEGLSFGYESVAVSGQNHKPRVLILSDGLANTGVKDKNEIKLLAENVQKKGITTSSFGVGKKFDELLMTGLADTGGGNAYFIEDPEDTAETFWDELNFLKHITASNCYLKFENENVVEECLLLNFYNKTENGWFIGDISSAEDLKLVFEIKIKPQEDVSLLKLGKISVVDEKGADLAKSDSSVDIDVVNEKDLTNELPDAEVLKEAVLLSIAKALRHASSLANDGGYRGAADVLEEYYRALSGIDVSDPEVDLKLGDLKEKISQFRQRGEHYYTEKEKKYMLYEQEMLGKSRHGQYNTLMERKRRINKHSAADDDKIIVKLKDIPGAKHEDLVFSDKSFSAVADFLKAVYTKIKDLVPVYSYGKNWVLRDIKTGRIPNIGSYWVRQNTKSNSPEDKRSLKEAGILAGMSFEVVLKGIKTSTPPRFNNQGNSLVIFSNDPRSKGRFPLYIPYNSQMVAAEFLKVVYKKISDVVPPYSYGRKWALANLTAGHLIDAGSAWAQSMNMNADIRPIGKIDIKSGDIIELIIF